MTIYKPIPLDTLLDAYPHFCADFLSTLRREAAGNSVGQLVSLGDLALYYDPNYALTVAGSLPQFTGQDFLSAVLPSFKRAMRQFLDFHSAQVAAVEAWLSHREIYSIPPFPCIPELKEAEWAIHNVKSLAGMARGSTRLSHPGTIASRALSSCRSLVSDHECRLSGETTNLNYSLLCELEERIRQTQDIVAIYGATREWGRWVPANRDTGAIDWPVGLHWIRRHVGLFQRSPIDCIIWAQQLEPGNDSY